MSPLQADEIFACLDRYGAAAMLGVDARVLERDHEPHLFRLGLATTTPNGRVLRKVG